MHYIWKKNTITLTLIPCVQMCYDKIQSFGGISHLVIVWRGEFILYLDVVHYIADWAHAIIMTDYDKYLNIAVVYQLKGIVHPNI